MKTISKEEQESLRQIELGDFLTSYNKNLPERFSPVTTEILLKFKNEHPGLFKYGKLWSLDQHRKKVMDWLPLKILSRD